MVDDMEVTRVIEGFRVWVRTPVGSRKWFEVMGDVTPGNPKFGCYATNPSHVKYTLGWVTPRKIFEVLAQGKKVESSYIQGSIMVLLWYLWDTQPEGYNDC